MRRVIYYNVNDYSGISSMHEFYDGVPGLRTSMKKYKLKPYHLSMNIRSCERLLDFMLSRVPVRDVGRFRWEVLCGHDWLNNAPNVSCKEVPPNEIWFESKEEA